jgi:hypothetical protein
MVSGARFEVVRGREPLRDLAAGERIASFLAGRKTKKRADVL